jgi:MFS family permease
MKFGLFRHLNFTAAVVSQFLAGSIELATAYLLPFYLLLVLGLAPGPAGLSLIPATVPIIIVAPLAGRWFDRIGGRLPLAVGFLVLAASSFALVAGFPSQSLMLLIPGFLLQGIGLGIVLTVNDPTALGSMPVEDQGQASGINDTGEQLGGAVGIAVFTVILLHIYFGRLFELLAGRGITPTQSQMHRGREFVLRAEQKGLRNVTPPPFMRDVLRQFEDAHVHAYQLTFAIMGFVSVVGAAVCWLLVRRKDHLAPTGIFSRRSRWTWATTGEGPGLTRKPPLGTSGPDGQGNQAPPDRRAE